jgi:hypothetical protein
MQQLFYCFNVIISVVAFSLHEVSQFRLSGKAARWILDACKNEQRNAFKLTTMRLCAARGHRSID